MLSVDLLYRLFVLFAMKWKNKLKARTYVRFICEFCADRLDCYRLIGYNTKQMEKGQN